VRFVPLIAWLVLVGALASPATAASPKLGTFAGSIGITVPRGAEAEVRAVDRATGALVGADEIGRNGRFSLRLPAGAYTVIGTVVSPRRGAKPVTVVSAVSLKPGQKRTKANLKRTRRKKPKRARAAYVQERGQVTPGRIALEIPDVTGNLSGDFSAVRRGLNDLAVTDLVGGYAKVDCDIAVIEVDRRADVLKELEFQQSAYVDPSTRVQRNFVLGDVEVVGRATQVGADRIEVTYGLRDKRTGADLGSVKGTAGGDRFFDDLERLSQQLANEVCKLSDTYEVTIDVRGQGNFATHAASAAMQATLTARRANRKAQTWTRTGPIAWTPPAIVSKTECAYVAPVVPTVAWTVTLTVAGEDRLKVEWGLDAGDTSTASVDCPPSGPKDPDPPPVPGQPGTALLTTGPTAFLLPFAGGVEQLRGEVSAGGDGFFNTGTMTVKPGPIVRVDD
jgi:hypothetical protein